jgi:hypothetical protein
MLGYELARSRHPIRVIRAIRGQSLFVEAAPAIPAVAVAIRPISQ